MLALVACGPRDDLVIATPPPPTDVRHETGPLVSRFPALGTPASASWVTWNSSAPDDRVPGPSTYWLDAVVHLDPATTTTLLTQYQPTDAGKAPKIQELLRSVLMSTGM